jgi:hypothetical protein
MVIATYDFETEAIVGNPLISPPRPIGVAVWLPDEEPDYLPISFTKTDKPRGPGYEVLRDNWDKYEHLYHNAPFDLSVAAHWLKLPWPAWDQVHDTQYLVFQYNPYGNLALKPASEEILGLEPEEQDELHDWIIANVPQATKKTAGAYICEAPFELVKPYAIGDVVRTKKLFDFCMGELYDAI